MISYTTVELRFHDFPCKMRYPFVFGSSVSKMAACLTDVVGMTSNARIFIDDTRTQQKRCSILNTGGALTIVILRIFFTLLSKDQYIRSHYLLSLLDIYKSFLRLQPIARY